VTVTSKARSGRFFEDFHLGQVLRHATPRTVTTGDAALYTALYGSRFAVQSADVFARSLGYPTAPLDDLLVFHIVFGKSVPDVSLNAVANLGYAECRFVKAVYAGDTLYAVSEVIGTAENSKGKTGTVYVRTQGFNQNDELVLSFVRWVMVRKREEASVAPPPVVPELGKVVAPEDLGSSCPAQLSDHWDGALTGSPHRFGDYAIGEKIDHVDGLTVEEAEHQLATRLYQNTARVHFDALEAKDSRFGRRLVYGGHVISVARALTFNGLANAFHIAAINGGRHVAPFFAGGTVYAWSEIMDAAALPGRRDVGALRIMTRATNDLACRSFPVADAKPGAPGEPGVILELDYWVLIPA
jgi:2-methylfumaryl-CoA hydratase